MTLLLEMEKQSISKTDRKQYLIILAYHSFGAGAYITMKDAYSKVIDDLKNKDTALIIADLINKGSIVMGLDAMKIDINSNNKKVIDYIIINTVSTIYTRYENEINITNNPDYLMTIMDAYFNLGVTVAISRIDAAQKYL